MKVFISWSGERSRGVANAIRQWLPGVIQAIKPYFSPDDVAKGTRWASEIAAELEASKIGMLVITPENVEAPWLVFEAGALSKNLDKSRVVPLLFDIEPTDVKGPLVQFQGAKFDQAEMRRVVRMINAELGEASLATEVLDRVFDMWWPKLEEDIGKVLAGAKITKKDGARSERDMLEEVLALTRSLSRDGSSSDFNISSGAMRDLSMGMDQLLEIAKVMEVPELDVIAKRLSRPVEYLTGKFGDGDSTRRRRERELARLLAADDGVASSPKKST